MRAAINQNVTENVFHRHGIDHVILRFGYSFTFFCFCYELLSNELHGSYASFSELLDAIFSRTNISSNRFFFVRPL